MRKNSLKGFSLFEILIVLVILIIIIGIGHPLWSGAVVSAQKTTALSHLRQLSQCVFLYVNDNEGKLPSGYVKDNEGKIERKAEVPIPAIFPPNSPEFDPNHRSHWSNQLFVYAKHPELYTAPGFIGVGDENKPHVAFTYNGLLHDYPLAQVSEPSRVPIFWCGLGGIALAGLAFTNPYIVLKNQSNQSSNQNSYKSGFVDKDKSNQSSEKNIKYGDAFVSSTLVASDQLKNIVKHTYGSFWIYDKSLPMVYLDGSARAVRIDKITNPPFTLDDKGFIENSKKSITHADYFIPR